MTKAEPAEVKSGWKNCTGVTHEFFRMTTIVPEAKEWQAYAVKKLKEAFEIK